MARPRRNPPPVLVPQFADSPDAAVVTTVPVTAAEPVEALEAFIGRHEQAAMAEGLAVTRISHPDATDRIYPGKYAGFPTFPGELQARYSDGSIH